jgi:hypothetical protein
MKCVVSARLASWIHLGSCCTADAEWARPFEAGELPSEPDSTYAMLELQTIALMPAAYCGTLLL